MSNQGIRYDVADGVASIVLDRPERRNALDLATGRRYNQCLLEADRDPAVRVVLVAGEGRAFCSGADLSALAAADLPAEERLPADALRPELAMLVRKPVVTAVHGPAIGVGLVLALYADVRFVAHDAVLALGFSRLGLVAEYATAWLLPRLIGVGRAAELLLSGRRFSGDEALALGLAHRALPAGEVVAAARAYATEMVERCSPEAMAAAKEQLRSALGPGLGEALADSRERMLRAFDGPELAEGFAAQAARRAPRFAPLSAEVD